MLQIIHSSRCYKFIFQFRADGKRIARETVMNEVIQLIWESVESHLPWRRKNYAEHTGKLIEATKTRKETNLPLPIAFFQSNNSVDYHRYEQARLRKNKNKRYVVKAKWHLAKWHLCCFQMRMTCKRIGNKVGGKNVYIERTVCANKMNSKMSFLAVQHPNYHIGIHRCRKGFDWLFIIQMK